MNKRVNTVVFIFAATVFNVIVTMACFLIMIVLYSQFLLPMLPEDSIAWALPVMFVFSIVAAIFIYRALIKLLAKKINVEKYFDPIFNRARRQY